MPDDNREKYQVTFGVYDKPYITMRTWSAVYHGDSFAEIEEQANTTLEENNDNESFIFKIERW